MMVSNNVNTFCLGFRVYKYRHQLIGRISSLFAVTFDERFGKTRTPKRMAGRAHPKLASMCGESQTRVVPTRECKVKEKITMQISQLQKSASALIGLEYFGTMETVLARSPCVAERALLYTTQYVILCRLSRSSP